MKSLVKSEKLGRVLWGLFWLNRVAPKPHLLILTLLALGPRFRGWHNAKPERWSQRWESPCFLAGVNMNRWRWEGINQGPGFLYASLAEVNHTKPIDPRPLRPPDWLVEQATGNHVTITIHCGLFFSVSWCFTFHHSHFLPFFQFQVKVQRSFPQRHHALLLDSFMRAFPTIFYRLVADYNNCWEPSDSGG